MPRATTLFQTVNPDGSITFDFTGKIHAQGLDIDAQTQGSSDAPGTVNLLDWLYNGVPIGKLWTFGSPAQYETHMKSEAPATATASADIEASSGGAVPINSALTTRASQPAGTASAEASVNGVTKVIYNNNAQSDFLQLLATGKARVNFGNAQATFAGGSPVADKVVAHNMGVVPSFLIAIPIQIFEIACFSEIVNGGTGVTNFTARVETRDGSSPAAGVNKSFYWAAIG